MSRNGKKYVLIVSVEEIFVYKKAAVETLAEECDEHFPVLTVESTIIHAIRTHHPEWTPDELEYLAQVIDDLRNFVGVQKLHQKPETRAELDVGRNDLWSSYF